VTRSNDIDARTLKDMLERGERVTLVDVRRREEHAEESIPGSVTFFAYDALRAGKEGPWKGWGSPRAGWKGL
jgi:rhodanese-related sulfurtransferase